MATIPLDSLVRAEWLRKDKERRQQEQEQIPIYEEDQHYYDPPMKED